MSGFPFAVTPKLPAQLTGTFPIVVTKSGLAYDISFGLAISGSVTLRQFFSAVAALYNMNTLFTAVSANANDPAWIQFYTSSYIFITDPLALLTQTTFGLTVGQMQTLFAYAASLPA